MLRQITGTIAARTTTTAIGLLVSVIAGHKLGAEGLGTIGLIVLGITLIRLGTDIVGGTALVYLVPRASLGTLLPPAYAGVIVAAAAGFGVLRLFRLVPEGYAGHVAILALMEGIYAVNLNVLVGQQRIRAYNFSGVAQSLLLVIIFGLLCRAPGATPMAFVQASYAAFGVTLVLSSAMLLKRMPGHKGGQGGELRLLLRQGLLVLGANAMQLINYRLAYWLIEMFRNTATLGVYRVATQLAEGSWLVPKSLGLVLYSKVSNSRDPQDQRQLTLTLLKASMACASAVAVVLILLPDGFFSWAFGPEIHGLRPLIALLLPGILAMAASQAFSHYFSGTARNRHNLIGSGLGLIFTVAAGFTLIPAYGLAGAAISASLAYVANGLYQAVAFMRISRSSFSELWPNAGDFSRIRAMLSALFRN